jgi:hypothetical protein
MKHKIFHNKWKIFCPSCVSAAMADACEGTARASHRTVLPVLGSITIVVFYSYLPVPGTYCTLSTEKTRCHHSSPLVGYSTSTLQQSRDAFLFRTQHKTEHNIQQNTQPLSSSNNTTYTASFPCSRWCDRLTS